MPNVKVYWEAALTVVDSWAGYQRVKHLLINFTHDETRHKVKDVVDRYYGGSLKRLRIAEEERSAKVNLAIHDFVLLCEANGVEPVNRDWLYHHLREGKDYKSYRGKVCRRLNGGKPAQSLRDL